MGSGYICVDHLGWGERSWEEVGGKKGERRERGTMVQLCYCCISALVFIMKIIIVILEKHFYNDKGIFVHFIYTGISSAS